MQKVDEIVGTLTEGEFYLVPTITGSLGGHKKVEEYPIIGPRHYDVEFFNIHSPHYHLDLRFINNRYWRDQLHCEVVVAVGRRASGELPTPQYKKLICIHRHIEINTVTNASAPGGHDQLRKHFAGTQCGGSRETGWICPHKRMFLGSQPASYGIITCPGHGLKINADTGKVCEAVQ